MTKITTADGKVMEATQLKFDPVTEPFQEYRLEDGTLLRIRVRIETVFRIDDASEADKETGLIPYRVSYGVDMNTIQKHKKKPNHP